MTIKQAISILEQRQCCRECVADCTCKECDDAFDMAIKTLEQEQKTDILDKIRAEIAEEKIELDLDIGNEILYNNAIDDCLQIIDKYRSEG